MRKHGRMWSTAAAILGLTALAVGLSACGSDSSSGDTSSVVRQAGSEVTDEVKLTVINDSPGDVVLKVICATTVERRCGADAVGPRGRGVGLTPLGEIVLGANTDGKYVTHDGREIWQPTKPGSGPSVTANGDPVDVTMRLDNGNYVASRSTNPTVGEPWISVDPSGTLFGDITKWHLSEGQTQDTTVGGNVFFVHRDADESRPYPETDLKVMTLTIAR